MSLLTVANLTHAHGTHVVLNGTNLTVNAGQRIGLVGRNGCGKSTLMKMIAGQMKADSGQVQLARGAKAGYLAQDPLIEPGRTLRKEAEQAFAELAGLHEQLEQCAHEMADAGDDVELDRCMKRYHDLEGRIETLGGYAIDHRIDAMLHGLGLGDELFEVKVGSLSGGQKARLALAKLLLTEPDVLLLDEPTNHLDIAGRQWLEQFLKGYRGAVMLVSHDRWLLDEVADQIVELDRGKIVEYPGNYHAYREQRALRMLEQGRVYEKQQEYIKQQKQFINKYRAGQRSKQAHGRELLLNRFIENETIENTHEAGVMGFKLPPAPRSGDQVIVAHNISAKYDDRTLFEQVTMTIQRGQRIGVIGSNGCGKSTLIRTMLGMRETDSGKVKLGASVSVGYYHQTHEHLPDELTPVGYLKRFFKSEGEQRARDLAGAFGFSGIDQDKPLGVLSGGERTRTVLAGLMVGGHNLLVLDEPSNHLDIPSSERLEESLQQFDGTLLLITHDRMLLEDTVNELLVFEEAGTVPGEGQLPGAATVRYFAGTYREYVEQCKREEAKRTQAAAMKREAEIAKPRAAEVEHRNKSNAKRNTRWGHLSRKDLEQRIAGLEKRRTELDAILADVDLYRDPAKAKSTQADRKKTQEELSPLEEEWLRRTEEPNL